MKFKLNLESVRKPQRDVDNVQTSVDNYLSTVLNELSTIRCQSNCGYHVDNLRPVDNLWIMRTYEFKRLVRWHGARLVIDSEETMQKTTQQDYMTALEEANSAIEDDCQDDNEAGLDLSEAEQAALKAKPPMKRRTDKPLTEQQRLFATLVIQGKTQRVAYREAYNTSMSDSAVSSNASKLANDPRIANMISAAWDETIEHLADDVASTKRYVLRKLVALSKDAKQEGSRLKALELLGKSVGIFTVAEEKAEKAVSADQLKRELSGHLKLLDNVKPIKVK